MFTPSVTSVSPRRARRRPVTAWDGGPAPWPWSLVGARDAVYSRSVTRVALAALTLAACQSSAPYTLPAALANTGLALGVSAAHRAGGGCYATCTGGTVCNPATGYCEAASAREVCGEAPGGGVRCTPVDVRASRRAEAGAAPAPVATEVGVSPATGSTPPAPAEASPKAP